MEVNRKSALGTEISTAKNSFKKSMQNGFGGRKCWHLFSTSPMAHFAHYVEKLQQINMAAVWTVDVIHPDQKLF